MLTKTKERKIAVGTLSIPILIGLIFLNMNTKARAMVSVIIGIVGMKTQAKILK